jgi:thymidylate kinase
MFIIVEGPNGAGKTSLINNLYSKGYKTLSSPNGTALASMLRPACRGTEPWEDIDKQVQFLLFSAARLDEYIRCIHNNSEIIFADRWWLSTYVYQCIYQGISVDFMEYTIHPNEKVDMVILLDGDDDELIDRVLEERKNNPSHGICRWTQSRESMKELISVYRNELPKYLKSKNIPVYVIMTSNFTKDEVCQKVIDIIEDLQKDKS